ncbi:hypothetical protein Chor_013069 [Crotalus horridus]
MAAAEREACEAAAKEAEEQREGPGLAPAPAPLGLTELPGELLELILCCGSLGAADLARLARTCRHLREACQPCGKVWREQLRRRWPSLMKYYNQADSVNWLEEYKERHKAGLKAQTIVASFSKRFFSEHYYAKKILYFLRQQNILKKLKTYLEYPADEQSFLEGAVLIDQYCNPLSDITFKSIQAQIDDIAAKVCKFLKSRNPRHPTVDRKAEEEVLVVPQLELQGQVLDAMNCVLYEQLKYRGNEVDYYNCQNSYIHQVLIRRTGIPISLSVLYLTIAKQLGVQLEAVNFPSHFLLRWCQGKEGSTNIFDYTYIDAFGKGRQLTVKECEYLIGHHVTEEFYGVATAKEVLQRMVGNLLNIGKRRLTVKEKNSCIIALDQQQCISNNMSYEFDARSGLVTSVVKDRESTDQSYQLLRDSLDLYLAMYPDNVQHLMLQARLYFHLGIWPEKVLDILQHIQALDPTQQGAVGYLVQHTLEHIERRKEEAGPDVKLHSDEKHKDILFSVGLVMKHKRYGYNCVIYGWDPACMMGHEWIRNMNVHSLPHGPHQPFYNVLVEDGSCRYAAQENLELNPDPHEIPHPDVGRYFEEFADTYYVANPELEIRYPEDVALTCLAGQKTEESKE